METQPAPLISVILPLALPWEPVYRWEGPEKMPDPGTRIRVALMGRSYVGVVSGVGVRSTLEPSRILPAGEPVPGLEQISEAEIQFWRALSDYYLCSVGEVYKSAYPQMKTESEETAARVQQRMEQRLERLRNSLQKKHNDTVRARLEAQVRALELSLSGIPIQQVDIPELPADEQLIDSIRKAFSAGPSTVLLQDDNPELLLALAARSLRSGHSVLWLTPSNGRCAEREEAALRHGIPLLKYDSSLTAPRRRDCAAALRSAQTPQLIIGTRQALLLPFPENLGLILIEQEHDPAYKQESPDPRFHAREAAILLAAQYHARVLLSSPTPSLESRYNAISGRYGSVNPAQTSQLPPLTIIDIPAERRKRGMPGLLSRQLIDGIRQHANERCLLLCPSHSAYCSVEAVSEEALNCFSPAEAARLTIGTRAEYIPGGEAALSRFDRIALVYADAVFFGADDDFRRDERAFQSLMLLLRACKSAAQILLQTTRAAHPLWRHCDQHDTEGYADILLKERREAQYPPYTRMLRITLRDNAPKRLDYMAQQLFNVLSATDGVQMTGPYAPSGSEELRIIQLTLPRDRELKEKKRRIATLLRDFVTARHYNAAHVTLDVDPQ